MSDPIFVRTRYDYPSYTDYWSLVALSGYETVYVDEIDIHDREKCYIIGCLNGEWNAGWSDVQARIIFLDLEWRLDGEYPKIPGVSEVWCCDPWYARHIGAKYVPLGSHPGLLSNPRWGIEKLYDVAFMAYIYGRREHIKNQVQNAGLKIAPNGWGNERNDILQTSRMMLHVHQFDFAPTVAPQRFALAAAYRLNLVSESVTEPGIFENCVIFAPFAALRDKTKDMLAVANDNGCGDALYELLCERYTFRKCIEAAL